MQRGDRHTGHVMNFFGRKYLATVGKGFRHWKLTEVEGSLGRSIRSSLSGITQLILNSFHCFS